MKVVTKYRDIPFEEAVKCYEELDSNNTREIWESSVRGSSVTILTPSVLSNGMRCKGPFYDTGMINDVSGSKVVLCPHIAEIGD